MIVKSIADLEAAGQVKSVPNKFSSARYLLHDDGMGFTLTRTTVAAGQEVTMQYKNHIEANLIISGEGTLTDIETGNVYALTAGTMYAVDQHDKHRIHSEKGLDIVCVLSPALVGPEVHDEDGSYPLLDPDA